VLYLSHALPLEPRGVVRQPERVERRSPRRIWAVSIDTRGGVSHHAAEMQERTVEILEHILGRLEATTATTAQSWTA
jgi:hypothetical protein